MKVCEAQVFMSFTKGSVRMSETVLSHGRAYHCNTGRYFLGVHTVSEVACIADSLHCQYT